MVQVRQPDKATILASALAWLNFIQVSLMCWQSQIEPVHYILFKWFESTCYGQSADDGRTLRVARVVHLQVSMKLVTWWTSALVVKPQWQIQLHPITMAVASALSYIIQLETQRVNMWPSATIATVARSRHRPVSAPVCHRLFLPATELTFGHFHFSPSTDRTHCVQVFGRITSITAIIMSALLRHYSTFTNHHFSFTLRYRRCQRSNCSNLNHMSSHIWFFILLFFLTFTRAISYQYIHHPYPQPPPRHVVVHKHHYGSGFNLRYLPVPPQRPIFYRSSHVQTKYPPQNPQRRPLLAPVLVPIGSSGSPHDRNALHVKGLPQTNFSRPLMVPSPPPAKLPLPPQVIKFPGTCKFQRSPAACSFSSLCQATGGRLIEPCEGNLGLTCCVTHPKTTLPLNPFAVNGLMSNTGLAHQQTRNDRLRSLSVKRPSKGKEPKHPLPHFLPPYAMAPKVPEISAIVHPMHPRPFTSPSDNVISLPFAWPVGSSNLIHGLEPAFPGKHVEKYHNNKPAAAPDSSPDSDSSKNSSTPATESPNSFDELFRSLLGDNSTDLDTVSEDEICGRRVHKPTSRIVGGQNARFGEFPWQVHIRIGKHHCSGALVNRFYVLTAAHCVHQASLGQLSIVVGANDLEEHKSQQEPPQYFSAVKIVLHPKFTVSAINPDRFDIALVKLDKAAKYAPNVLPICLPPSLPSSLSLGGSIGFVTGWGALNPLVSNQSTRFLQKVEVPIIKDEECKAWHRTRGIFLNIYPEMFCAGYENGAKDACTGDSGGPFIVSLNERWTVVGITSAGYGCAEAGKPGIYHKVPVSVAWVKDKIKF